MKMFHCIDELPSMLFTFPFWCCPQSIWRKRVGIIGDVLGGLCDWGIGWSWWCCGQRWSQVWWWFGCRRHPLGKFRIANGWKFGNTGKGVRGAAVLVLVGVRWAGVLESRQTWEFGGLLGWVCRMILLLVLGIVEVFRVFGVVVWVFWGCWR